jgi:hypothetical protein
MKRMMYGIWVIGLTVSMATAASASSVLNSEEAGLLRGGCTHNCVGMGTCSAQASPGGCGYNGDACASCDGGGASRSYCIGPNIDANCEATPTPAGCGKWVYDSVCRDGLCRTTANSNPSEMDCTRTTCM